MVNGLTSKKEFDYRPKYCGFKKENITSSALEQAFGIRDGARLTHPEKLNLPGELRDTLLTRIHYKPGTGTFETDLVHVHSKGGTFQTGVVGSSVYWWRDFVQLQQAGRLSKLEFVKVDCSFCQGDEGILSRYHRRNPGKKRKRNTLNAQNVKDV